MAAHHVRPRADRSPSLTSTPPAPTVVTRVEISEHIAEAFNHPPADRDDLLAEAARTGARPAVIDLLEQLPARSYPNLRGLWPHLADVPIGA